MERYIESVLRFRAWVIIGCGVLTAVAFGIISQGVVASSMLKLFFGQNPAYNRYVEFSEQFGATDNFVIAFEDPELMSPKGLDRLQRIVERIERVPQIRSVQSVLSAERVRGEDDELLIEHYAALARISTASAAIVRAELAADPDLGGLLLSPDGRSAAVLLELTNDTDRPVESIPILIEDVLAPFIDEGYQRKDLHLAGLGPETAEATSVAMQTILQIFPFTVLVLTFVVFVLFRRVWPVLVTSGVAFISIVWTVAFAVIWDRQINLLIAAVPAVMVTVAFSDIIHLCSTYLLEIEAGYSKVEAIVKSGKEVGLACVWTSVTTFFGFASLAFIPTPVFQQLGMVLAFGVAVALLLALTLVPIFLYYLPAPTGELRNTQRSGRFIQWVCRTSGRTAIGYPKLTVLAFVVLAVVSLLGVQRIIVETSFGGRLESDNPIRVARRFIQERFVGTNTVDVYLELPDDQSFSDPKFLAEVAKLEAELEAKPQIDRVISFVDLLERVESALGFSKDDRSRQSVAQSLLLFEMAGGSGIDRLVSADRRVYRLGLRLSTDGLVETGHIGHEVARMAEERLGPSVHATPTGITFLFGDWIEFIIEGQKRGLFFAFVTTTLLMMAGLRSIRVGALSMIPNMLPLAVLGGYVGWAWEHVDSDTILVAMIGIGIAVDDTIHFLTRLRIESLATDDPHEALDRTFHFTGSAIVQTSVILCLGFLPFCMSAYFSTRILGTLLPLTLIVALLADLLLLPALVELGIIRFRRADRPVLGMADRA